ncbi:universal stress protein [Oryzicola mucosus]|uniref:Universal stress protein n=1 Tax=Oryzicola mucosus TaxID=2767425 RepID=A0A8J6U478_9HYPH|nr:universal stress protein [Oryzicola mucosus]MBD0413785.1 universal stress protein [Oryzicola mucosus]
MTYKSVLVNLDIDKGDAAGLVRYAADFARHFGARLVGVTAADVTPPVVTMEGMVVDGELITQQREDIEQRIAELEGVCREAAGAGIDVDWRGQVDNPTRYLSEIARLADVIVTGPSHGSGRSVDLGTLLLDAGRPVLVAAEGAQSFEAGTVLVAWKDSREARRAVRDAVPLLVAAKEVVVATVDREGGAYLEASLADVAGYLALHGAKVRTELITGHNDSGHLVELADSIGASTVVSGAYGHSRLRQWIFGGVTHSLLGENRYSRFMVGG